jgi:hypothetical protein
VAAVASPVPADPQLPAPLALVFVQLERFDTWFSRRIEGRRLRPLWLALAFPTFLAMRFLGLVAVLEITIIAFSASIYLVWGEWLLLLLLFSFALLARLAHLLPWRLTAHAERGCWTTRITGRTAGRHAIEVAHQALRAGHAPPLRWTETRRRSRIWM